MARGFRTLQVDAVLTDALERAAKDKGLELDEVVEGALRRYFGLRGLAILSDLAERQPPVGDAMTDDQAMALAISEIRVRRAKHRAAS